jgi:hypothetical protein
MKRTLGMENREAPNGTLNCSESGYRICRLMRDKTGNPIIKRNADKTIATLKRMEKRCGNASAC